MVPGSNLLNMALRIIAKQTVQWSHATSRVNNSIGLLEVTYATPVAVVGSFQPVPRNLFEKLGLDFNKEYVSYFTSHTFQDVARDVGPDQFVFAGDTWECMSNTDWTNVDGWLQSLAVKIS